MDEAPFQNDPRILYRELDGLLKRGIESGRQQSVILDSFPEESLRALGERLHLKAALFYQERDDSLVLEKMVGDPGGEVARSLDLSLRSLQMVFRNRAYVFEDPDSECSPYHDGILPRSATAAVLVGRRPNRYLLFYILRDGWAYEELSFTLNVIRSALGMRLLGERLRGSFKEAAAVQQSLLPDEPPIFNGYDIACNSVAADEVSGDFYDFFPFSNGVLGIAIGDASGHGLPAALLVRDVVTGLRMGLEKDLKPTRVLEKLNHVIHRSMLSSRFVSLFYGELESTGNFLYVNAGQLPPLIFSKNSVESLQKGGIVIGPLPEVSFKHGITNIEPGALLLLCTDGINERRNSQGAFFGETHLEHIVRSNMGKSAQEILDLLFASAYDFGGKRSWDDDATAVVIIRK